MFVLNVFHSLYLNTSIGLALFNLILCLFYVIMREISFTFDSVVRHRGVQFYREFKEEFYPYMRIFKILNWVPNILRSFII